MSFLLLKSNRKVQQGGSDQQRFGAGNIRNSNSLPVATLTPTSSSRTASSFTTSTNSIIPQYNRLLNNGSSVVTPMSRAANAGDGQLQLLRSSQNQFQKKNYNSQRQSMTNQRSVDSQNMEIVSMEEVMEDLRILEQQQRDSQRQLQSVKITKQHKLSQKEKMEQTLAALKYKNGQYKVQLTYARQVLSKSTRSLATAKLRADKSSDHWKKFNENLKRSIETIRSLHEKRRTVDDLILKLREKETICKNDSEEQKHLLENTLNELEDLKHTEQMLLKSVQSAKSKLQETMEYTGKIRSELGELDLEMTETQQMEASMKMRVDGLLKDLEKEKSRHDHARAHHDTRMLDLLNIKEDMLQQIEKLKQSCERNDHELLDLFNKCVQTQKYLGHALSDSPRDAKLDLESVRSLVEEVKLKTFEDESKATHLAEIIGVLESEKSVHIQRNHVARCLIEELDIENRKRRISHEKRCSDRETFIDQVESSKQKVHDLRILESSCKQENIILQESLDSERAELEGALKAVKERFVELTVEVGDLHEKYQNLLLELKQEKNESNRIVHASKDASENARQDLENVQKKIDELSNLPHLKDDKSVEEMNQEEEKQVSELLARQAELILEYPCLADIKISNDIKKSKKLRINSALSEIRASCEARIEACRAERHRRIAAKQEEMKAQTLIEKRARQESYKYLESKHSSSKTSSFATSKRLAPQMLRKASSGEGDDASSFKESSPRIYSNQSTESQKVERSHRKIERYIDRRSSSKRMKEQSFSFGSDNASVESEVRSIHRHFDKSSTDTFEQQKKRISTDLSHKGSGDMAKNDVNIRKLKSNDRKDVSKKYSFDAEYGKSLIPPSECNADDEWTYDGTVSTTRSKVRFENETEKLSAKKGNAKQISKRPSTITISSDTGKRQKKDQLVSGTFRDDTALTSHDVDSVYDARSKSQDRKPSLSNDHSCDFVSKKKCDPSEHVDPFNKHVKRLTKSSQHKVIETDDINERSHALSSNKAYKMEKHRSNSSIVREKLSALKRKDTFLSQTSSRRRKKSKPSGAGLSFNDDDDLGFLKS